MRRIEKKKVEEKGTRIREWIEKRAKKGRF